MSMFPLSMRPMAADCGRRRQATAVQDAVLRTTIRFPRAGHRLSGSGTPELDHSALTAPSITFWTARDGGTLLGCGALKRIDSPPGSGEQGEIKSMRTTASARGRGVATLVLNHILDEARRRNYERIFLETGAEDYFSPARRLYVRNGFTDCPPFADYTLDPNSVFMELRL